VDEAASFELSAQTPEGIIMNQERVSSKRGRSASQGTAGGRPALRRGPSGAVRAIGGLAALAVTFALLQSVTSLFMSAPEMQMAKANSTLLVASGR
jgi:hypothetical protein